MNNLPLIPVNTQLNTLSVNVNYITNDIFSFTYLIRLFIYYNLPHKESFT